MTIPAQPPSPEQQPPAQEPEQPAPEQDDVPPPTQPEKEIALYQRIDELEQQLAEANGQQPTQQQQGVGVSLPPAPKKPEQKTQPSAASYFNTGHFSSNNSGH